MLLWQAMALQIALLCALLSDALRLAPSWELRTSQSLINGLRGRTTNVRPLDLITDLHDVESGLCSEGVWHNAWLGTAYVQAARQLRRDGSLEEAATFFDYAVDLADSLYELGFDDGFRRRTASGIWRTSDEMAIDLQEVGESALFYAPSCERRSIQNGAAVIFYSLLSEEAMARGSGEASRLAVRNDEVGDAFLKLFYNVETGRFRRGADTDGHAGAYWRAVDQAVGALACLRLERLDPRWCNTNTGEAREAARSAVLSLLRDFGYAEYATNCKSPLNHLGEYPGLRNRNSWHDGLACLAIAVFGEAAGGDGLVSANDVAGLIGAMSEDYRACNGLLVHQRQMLEVEQPDKQVQFTCTQAIWGAVGSVANEVLADSDVTARSAVAEHSAAWRRFCKEKADVGGLLPVANVYPDARLWCNTEPAAWLLMERADFAPEPPKPVTSLFWF